MATCNKCNASIPDDSLFCNHCGAKQELACAACGAVLPGGSKFCNRCGAPVGGATETAKVCATRPFSKEWEAFTNRGDIAGNSRYHFMKDNVSSKNENGIYVQKTRLYRIDAAGTVVMVENLPSGGNWDEVLRNIAWAENKLWLTLTSDLEYGYHYLYTLDPETMECSLVTQIGTRSCDPYIDCPYVTADALYFDVPNRSGYESNLIKMDRKTGEKTTLYTGRFGIRAVGEKCLWISESNYTSSGKEYWQPKLMDQQGNSTVLYEHPDFAPLMPLIAELTGDTLPVSEGEQGQTEWAAFVDKHILYIDFKERLVYLCQSAQDPEEGVSYVLPFRATQRSQSVEFWKEANVSPASLENFVPGCSFRKQYNGRYCVGFTRSFQEEVAVERGPRTFTEQHTSADFAVRAADGSVVELGTFLMDKRRGSSDFVLLNDTVYYYSWHGYHRDLEGRYILHPGADKPEFQELKLD